MILVDSHCHVAEPEYDADREQVLERARAAGVAQFVVPGAGGTLETNLRALALCERDGDCRAVVGVHPHDAKTLDDSLYDRIAELASRAEVVGIGETGLDFHYDHSPRDRQAEAFRRFIALARSRSLPLVVHSRSAADDTAAILREERAGPGVMHCFTYGAPEARMFLDLGFYISFSGIVTFRNAEEVRAAARIVPRDRLLIETDSPYLAPEPKRGGRNEPCRVRDVAIGLANALGAPAEEIAAISTENARRLFRL